ncbi:putative membrane protein [Geosmithia morbida]|uniref:Membrane protein n=1 Tax=Geosmithia morbida TaxID=1094350 RepID=A0A9P4YYR1_9HYPO|nr:uncharacterized protein GMORB2_5955 [Geosmithia morbida]KAF4124239.1 putative membrane protein [Geosmithia morbida]
MKPIIAIPATSVLVFRAWKKRSLTGPGLVTAALTALAHAYHPWNLPFTLLCVFFLAGTRVTHVKEGIKAKLTMTSKGSSGGEGPRNHVQGSVLANSLVSSILTILHANQLYARQARLADPNESDPLGTTCFQWGGDVLVVGIIANYAAVAADTFSSELGILATGQPRLITSLTLRRVPRGTNGGVTLTGLGAGLLGSIIIVTTAMVLLPLCGAEQIGFPGGEVPWSLDQRRTLMGGLVLAGFAGTVIDSILGGLFQRSVKDTRSGKIVEGEGGQRVLISEDGTATAVTGSSSSHGDDGRVEKKTTTRAAMRPRPATVEDDDEEEDKSTSHFGDEKPSRVAESGWDLLDNNDVNFLMAVMSSVGAMAVASWYWEIPAERILVV